LPIIPLNNASPCLFLDGGKKRPQSQIRPLSRLKTRRFSVQGIDRRVTKRRPILPATPFISSAAALELHWFEDDEIRSRRFSFNFVRSPGLGLGTSVLEPFS
jgi:hypothetical protein